MMSQPARCELTNWDSEQNLALCFHPGQLRAWHSEARFVAVTAGTQSGKTSFAPYWLYREISKRGPGDYLFVTPTYPLLELKALPEFLRLFQHALHLGRYFSTPRRVFLFDADGCRRTFAEWDAEHAPPTRVIFGYATDPESLESATAKAAVCDEAGQKKFKLEAWQAILRRLSLAMGRALLTTSLYTLGWLKAKYDGWQAGDKDWEFIAFDSTENPSFPREEFERARRELPAWKFDMLYRGRWTRPAGLIYDCLTPEHKLPRFGIPWSWKRYVGLDFGSQNMAAVFLAEEPSFDCARDVPFDCARDVPFDCAAQDGAPLKTGGRLYLYRTYHHAGEAAAGHVRRLRHGEPPGLPYVVGGAKSERDWRAEFRGAGLPVREPKTSDVEVGINRVYGALQRGELFYFDDLAEFDDEITSYARELDAQGNPTDAIEDKHAYHLLDALRYVVSDIRGEATTRMEGARREEYKPNMPKKPNGPNGPKVRRTIGHTPSAIRHRPVASGERSEQEIERLLERRETDGEYF